MTLVKYYKCRRCDSTLDYSKAFLRNSNLFVTCKKCNIPIVIHYHLKCCECQNPAKHLERYTKQPFASTVTTTGYNYYCDNHFPFSPKLEFLRDGNLIHSCYCCDKEFIIQKDVKCEKCSKPATAIEFNDIKKTRRPFCSEHHDEFLQNKNRQEKRNLLFACIWVILLMMLFVLFDEPNVNKAFMNFETNTVIYGIVTIFLNIICLLIFIRYIIKIINTD